jgi:O-antigen/teichoic acid export membrane protein
MSSNKVIVKNTVFLYMRMILIMLITLYSSRIVLEQLGVSDYGIYSLVGGFVALLGFFNSAMSSATQRYLSFDIGRGDFDQLKKTFNATLTIHIAIAIVGLLLAETIGLWYINNKMIFPENRYYAVNFVYQFSILTFLLNIVQVPYNALIIARERMKMFAYVSVLEAILKLSIVFILIFFGSDKLIVYSFLTFLIALIIRIIYQIYCRKEFDECAYEFRYDKKYYKELISYSGWNLFGNIASVAKGQGVNIVLNLFFGTIVNAAYGITSQVFSAINMFVSNFQLALNPQIIKNYSQGDLNQSYYLISQGSKFSYYLLIIIVTPILLNTDYILRLWLKSPPNFTLVFVQLTLVNILVDCLSGSLMTGAQATGKIKWYQIIVGTLVFLNLPISYFILRLGYEAYSVYLVSIIISVISLQFRLFFLKKVMGFDVRKYYTDVISKVLILGVISFFLIFLRNYYLNYDVNLLVFVIESIVVVGVLTCFIFVIGLSKVERNFIKKIIIKKK